MLLPTGERVTGISAAEVPSLPARSLQNIRNLTDTMFKENLTLSSDTLDKGMNKALSAFRRTVSDEFDNDSTIQALNKNYRTAHSSIDAYKTGAKLVKDKNLTVAEVEHYKDMFADDPEALLSLLEGAKSTLNTKLINAKDTQLPSLFSKTTNERAKLHALFGDKLTDLLYDTSKPLATMAKDKKFMNAVNTGVNTKKPSEAGGILDYLISGLGLATNKVSSAAGLGSTRRIIGNTSKELSASQERLLAEMLSQRGTGLQSLLGDMQGLVDKPSLGINPSRMVGGQVGGTAAAEYVQ